MERYIGSFEVIPGTQGISPFDDRAGVAEWQTSSSPSDACSPIAMISGRDGGTTMPIKIATRTITAFHFIN